MQFYHFPSIHQMYVRPGPAIGFFHFLPDANDIVINKLIPSLYPCLTILLNAVPLDFYSLTLFHKNLINHNAVENFLQTKIYELPVVFVPCSNFALTTSRFTSFQPATLNAFSSSDTLYQAFLSWDFGTSYDGSTAQHTLPHAIKMSFSLSHIPKPTRLEDATHFIIYTLAVG